MRRRDLAWLAIFLNPPAPVSRPLSRFEASAYVILENDECPILWSGVDHAAHEKDAYSKRLSNFSEGLREYTDPTPPHQRPQDNSHLVPELEADSLQGARGW